MDAILSGQKKIAELYDRLGCDRTSSTEQITAEYRARVRDCHPDKVGSDANSAFVQLQKAFDVLSDPQKRHNYDLWLDNPVPMDFEEFQRNSEALKMSMHWVTPKATPQISFPMEESSQRERFDWTSGRYQSDAARKFRNYEI